MRVPKFLTEWAASVLGTLAGLITKPRVVREAELVVDVAISLALAVIPGRIGWVACVGFFLLRDAVYASRQSPGKKLYNLKIVNAKTGATIGIRMSVVRNLILITPLLHLVDIAHFVKTGRRLTDEWLGVDVRQEGGGKETSEEGEDNPNPPTAD